MLGDLKAQPTDKILELVQMFREDTREKKVDLGVGVYKNAEGVTPIMRAVKAAEARLLETQTTKVYTTMTGEPEFAETMAGLILGEALSSERMAYAASVGGTGAVRQALELVRTAAPGATVWVSNPTWPNHPPIVRYVGLAMAEYRYFDEESRGVDFEGMMADLAGVKAGDVVLLHGCCHNLTGANLNLTQWAAVAELIEKAGAVALVDIAYQGFGDGLEADAAGTRLLVERLPEVMIAASCSKNFGIYRERTGILLVMCEAGKVRGTVQQNLALLNRLNFSFPPDHGARIVSTILSDAALRGDWTAELEEVRLSMLDLRKQLAGELQRLTGSDRFGYLAQHRGMFSRLGATPEQVLALREEHGIYMVGDSRMNVAGLNARTVPILAEAIVAVGI